jgi:hypothetical protein
MSDPFSERDLGGFIRDGFIRLDHAFPREVAEAACAILWRETGCDPADPATWTRPVIRLGQHAEAPFLAAANSPRLVAALDQVVGRGRWVRPGSLGTFPVRFPGSADPGDDGWHVDASFPGDDPGDYLRWRINAASRGRALLLLFLFSDVGADDAPTRIRVGSHRDVARILAPAGETGLEFMELAARLDVTARRPTAQATGAAGTVYLCHPFLVHAAQAHRGHRPRFLAQPPLLPAMPPSPGRPDGDVFPVEAAIREALEHEDR